MRERKTKEAKNKEKKRQIQGVSQLITGQQEQRIPLASREGIGSRAQAADFEPKEIFRNDSDEYDRNSGGLVVDLVPGGMYLSAHAFDSDGDDEDGDGSFDTYPDEIDNNHDNKRQYLKNWNYGDSKELGTAHNVASNINYDATTQTPGPDLNLSEWCK